MSDNQKGGIGAVETQKLNAEQVATLLEGKASEYRISSQAPASNDIERAASAIYEAKADAYDDAARIVRLNLA